MGVVTLRPSGLASEGARGSFMGYFGVLRGVGGVGGRGGAALKAWLVQKQEEQYQLTSGRARKTGFGVQGATYQLPPLRPWTPQKKELCRVWERQPETVTPTRPGREERGLSLVNHGDSLAGCPLKSILGSGPCQ